MDNIYLFHLLSKDEKTALLYGRGEIIVLSEEENGGEDVEEYLESGYELAGKYELLELDTPSACLPFERALISAL